MSNPAPAVSRVLIVDDSLTVRMDLVEAFEAAGFDAACCGTIALARETLARGGIDVVVLDVLLPDGNGIDLLREIRASGVHPELPVLILSSEAEVKDRIRGLRTGANEYVGKPYDTGHVVARARQFLQMNSGAPDAQQQTVVLVIDDSATFREQLVEALADAGYLAVSAPTGEQGLQVAADRRPGAIIVDGMLPGIDGATVIRHIRLDAALRSTPCLLLTASEDHGAELRALDAGADAFVHKGGDLALVLAKLAATLRGSATVDATTASLASPKKILAVDDSATYLQELADTLREDGYDVILARSGEEALALLAIQPVDCILLDLLMPGLDGRETCRRIKAAPIVRDIPLIMLTAMEERASMLEGLGAGADDYIAKSSEFTVLKARLRAQLRRRQFEDENRRIREKLMHTELEAAQARAGHELARARAVLVEELERKNNELEAFSYSVSHDLRAPLSAIAGFGSVLVREYAPQLDVRGQHYLSRVAAAASRMGELIDDLLELARVGRTELLRRPVNLSTLAQQISAELQRRDPDRLVEVRIDADLTDAADDHFMAIVLENLLGNAWKFTAKTDAARIRFGRHGASHPPVYVVRDNGAGFDMTYSDKLFRPFQRLHSEPEFPGTGIGLATVRRIIDRHGGRVWAEASPGTGAAFFFTIAGLSGNDT